MPHAVGHIAQVVEPVVDVHFDIAARSAEVELPRIDDALVVTRPDGKELVLEVQQHIGEDTVRCVAMDSTDGLSRGLEVRNTHQPIAMPAADSKAYKFVVITADNKYIKSGTATIEAGKYYQTPLTLEPRYPLALSSATAEWDLGAVACNDGQLYMEKKAAPAGKTAVGILGKVTETGHGLILALQDATKQSWNTINSWESVITSAGRTLKSCPTTRHAAL